MVSKSTVSEVRRVGEGSCTAWRCQVHGNSNDISTFSKKDLECVVISPFQTKFQLFSKTLVTKKHYLVFWIWSVVILFIVWSILSRLQSFHKAPFNSVYTYTWNPPYSTLLCPLLSVIVLVRSCVCRWLTLLSCLNMRSPHNTSFNSPQILVLIYGIAGRTLMNSFRHWIQVVRITRGAVFARSFEFWEWNWLGAGWIGAWSFLRS